jgi:hypothetical protein
VRNKDRRNYIYYHPASNEILIYNKKDRLYKYKIYYIGVIRDAKAKK